MLSAVFVFFGTATWSQENEMKNKENDRLVEQQNSQIGCIRQSDWMCGRSFQTTRIAEFLQTSRPDDSADQTTSSHASFVQIL